MKRETSLLARSLALMAMLTFAVLIILTVVAFVTQRQFLRATPYINALQQVNAYERGPGIIAELLVSSLDGPRNSLAQVLPLPELNQADTERFLASLLTRDWMQDQTEVIVHRAIAELNNDPPPSPAVLSLAAVKANLSGAAGREALLAVIETRPACGPADLRALTCGFDLAGEISCRPPTLNVDICGAAIDLALNAIVPQIPDEVSLDAVLPVLEPLYAPLRQHVQRYASAISLVALFGWLAAAPFFLLGSLLAIRSFQNLLRWWGAPLLAISLGLLPIIALTGLWPTWYIAAPLQELSSNAPSLATLIGDVATLLSRGAVVQLLVVAVLAGIVGLAMVGASFLMPAAQRWMAQG